MKDLTNFHNYLSHRQHQKGDLSCTQFDRTSGLLKNHAHHQLHH